MATAAVGQSSLREVRSVDRPQRRMDGKRKRILLLGQVPYGFREKKSKGLTMNRDCKHPANKVTADILEGDAPARAVQWCQLCGAYRVLLVGPGTMTDWRVPTDPCCPYCDGTGGVPAVSVATDALVSKHVPPCGGPDGGCTCGLEGGET